MNRFKESEAVVAPVIATGDPFEGPSDERSFYADAGREKVLNLLLHLAPYSDVLVLTGEQGSGKTAFCGRFIDRAPDNWRVFTVQGGAEVDEARLLDIMDRELAVRSTPDVDPAERMARLRRSLSVLRRGSLLPLLVIDDAHRLPPSAFAFLAALTAPADAGEERSVGVLLAGEAAGLEAGLDGSGARVAHTAALPPLSEEDTGAYIRHRLAAAGVAAEALYTPAVIRFISTASGGNPGRINELAGVVLHHREREAEAEKIADGTGRRVLLRYGFLTLAVSAVFLGVLYRDELSGVPSSDEARMVTAPAAAAADRSPVTGAEMSAIPPEPAERGIASSAGTENGAGVVPPAAQAAVEADPPPASAVGHASGGEAATREAAHLHAAEPHAVDVARAGSSSGTRQSASRADLPRAVEPQEDAMPAAMSPDPSPDLAPEPPPEPSPDGVARAEGMRSAAAASPPPGETAGPRREDWLLAQDAGAYTLQLFASEEARILRFIEEHALGERAAMFRARAGERPLYAVAWGVFATRGEALAAAGEAPVAGISGIEPWARAMGDIQRAIAAGNPARGD